MDLSNKLPTSGAKARVFSRPGRHGWKPCRSQNIYERPSDRWPL